MSLFDTPFAAASNTLFRVAGDTILINGLIGTGVVLQQNNIEIGNSIGLYNGVNMTVREAEYPNLAVHDEVEWKGSTYIIMELDDVDAAGLRNARLALK